ncbi:MAG: SPFH domain-containing protein [Ignavibacteriaceae bacterium]|nr:SPFH domain-containing protein [Ignavibacteriaceae bacterium]NUM70764.1 SPFH domain-containing protein [Ignavibacteriaceae bacterium]
MIEEKLTSQKSGWLMLILMLILIPLTIFWIVKFGGMVKEYPEMIPALVAVIFTLIIELILCAGFFTIEPKTSMVLLLFGKYVGTEKHEGFRWANPFYTKRKISLRSRNFETERLKVNDKKGNPIEISAVVVWQVANTAHAVFEVEHFEEFTHIQSDSALRHLASIYPYDSTEDEPISLRTSMDEISENLQKEIQDRVKEAGIVIKEARINHLAYAPEIAHAMLQRQQAEAIIAARTKIVDGAVGMVEMALRRLNDEKVVELDEERKAAMVSNLLVVLCSDKSATPVVNSGSLY